MPEPRCVPMSETVEGILATFTGIGIAVALFFVLVVWSLLIKPAFQDWRENRRRDRAP